MDYDKKLIIIKKVVARIAKKVWKTRRVLAQLKSPETKAPTFNLFRLYNTFYTAITF